MSKNIYPSTFELAEWMRDGTHAVIACMTVLSGRVPPHYVRDYVCVICAFELWLSPMAVEQVAIGGLPVCVECGLRIAEQRASAGHATEVYVSPDTAAALKRGTTVIDPARIERLRPKETKES